MWSLLLLPALVASSSNDCLHNEVTFLQSKVSLEPDQVVQVIRHANAGTVQKAVVELLRLHGALADGSNFTNLTDELLASQEALLAAVMQTRQLNMTYQRVLEADAILAYDEQEKLIALKALTKLLDASVHLESQVDNTIISVESAGRILNKTELVAELAQKEAQLAELIQGVEKSAMQAAHDRAEALLEQGMVSGKLQADLERAILSEIKSRRLVQALNTSDFPKPTSAQAHDSSVPLEVTTEVTRTAPPEKLSSSTAPPEKLSSSTAPPEKLSSSTAPPEKLSSSTTLPEKFSSSSAPPGELAPSTTPSWLIVIEYAMMIAAFAMISAVMFVILRAGFQAFPW